ncbi:Methyltransferase domain-containing protein [Nitrosomonas cryotolerans]|uniref:Methyltransferase domain-containing protein n=1 Tax=Nitrosomonas cryotolerans ATCC 49181 TaxID=1131553 RepID=A0A1N6JFU6_9PROT|nr:methyltransferase domain-containing protein [Nitrosomonas cryotolerans]SFP66915.1 Methyltransferase domain-containing protein [Nitrosomonas cryotolerans]SIO43019.1 Methyltransferase domain-containing protein [Nitrosomonas cryotolerans ATCC 49181]
MVNEEAKSDLWDKKTKPRGYVDSIEIVLGFLQLSGWAVNDKLEPVFNLTVVLDNNELAIWELKRVTRNDVSKFLKNASPLCGFIILIPLALIPKSAKVLNVIAKDSSSTHSTKLREGHDAKINWDYVRGTQNVTSSWLKQKTLEMPSRISDSKRVSIPNFTAIYGASNSGKTTLCKHLSSLENGIISIHADNIFDLKIAPNLDNRMDFWEPKIRDLPEHFNITKYIDSASYNHELFVQHLSAELTQKLRDSSNIHLVLLDGYVFKNYERIFSDLRIPAERTFAIHASKNLSETYSAGGFDVTDGHCYIDILKHIKQSFREKCQKITVPKITYQNLESLGIYDQEPYITSDSNTSLKYAASHLDDIIHTEDRFADIGCNAGFFCFRAAKKTTCSVNGVDMSRHWLEIASHVNNSILQHRNIIFSNMDAIEFLLDSINSFEIIHCSSTYHYFREQQIDFLKAANNALAQNGILVLEVEIANSMEKPEVIKKSRGVDSVPCAFPNREMFLIQISGLFEIVGEFDSVFQKGSFYNRKYFHLRRK